MTKALLSLCVVLLFGCFLSVQAQAQPSCSNASLSGTYFYVLSGTIAAGTGSAAYAELGKLIADGNGGVSGQSTASVGGGLVASSLGGNYVVQGNCTGTLTLSVNSQSTTVTTFQIIDGGQSAVVAFSSSGGVIVGRAYRAPSVGQCGNASLNGAYGYLLSGVVSLQGGSFLYSDAGQVVSDGNGGLTTFSVANLGAGASQSSGTGTYLISADCSGVARVINQNGTTNYIVAVVEGGNALFMENDAGTTVAGTAQAQLLRAVLPQFVFGGGWYSSLYFVNPNSSAVSFTVSFTSDGGTPLTVPGRGTSTVVNLAPHGTATIEASNVGSLSQGYATFALPAGVAGYGIFRQSAAGRSDQEAVVPFSGATGTSSTLAWDDTSFTTTIAVVNPSTFATAVNVTVWDSNGNLVGTSSIPLSPNNKTEAALRSLPGLAGMVGKRGSAQFTVSTGNVAVLGLRFGASAFTSIPTIQQ